MNTEFTDRSCVDGTVTAIHSHYIMIFIVLTRKCIQMADEDRKQNFVSEDEDR